MLTDEQIEHLLQTPKVVTNPKARTKDQRKSTQTTYALESECGAHRFELYARQNSIDPDHYSCGLIYHHPCGERIHLTRYNGSNHDHRNSLEGGELIRFKCHIHRATQRYIEIGDKAEKFAVTTDRYSDLSGALHCLIMDCCISGLHTSPPDSTDDGSQLSLI